MGEELVSLRGELGQYPSYYCSKFSSDRGTHCISSECQRSSTRRREQLSEDSKLKVGEIFEFLVCKYGRNITYAGGYHGSNAYSLHPSQNVKRGDAFVGSIELFHN